MLWRMLARDKKRTVSIVLVLLILAGSIPAAIAFSDANIIQIRDRTLELLRPTLELGIGYSSYTFSPDNKDIVTVEDKLDIYQSLWDNFTKNYRGSEMLRYVDGAILADFAVASSVALFEAPPEEAPTTKAPVVRSPSGYYLLTPDFGPFVVPYDADGRLVTAVIATDFYYMLAPLGDVENLGFRIIEGRLPEPGGDPPEAVVYAGIADYYGLRVGETATIAGATVKIVGLFEREGQIALIPGGFTSLGARIGILVHPDDIVRIYDSQSRYLAENPKQAALKILFEFNSNFRGVSHSSAVEWVYREQGNNTLILVPSKMWRQYLDNDRALAILRGVLDYAAQDQLYREALEKSLGWSYGAVPVPVGGPEVPGTAEMVETNETVQVNISQILMEYLYSNFTTSNDAILLIAGDFDYDRVLEGIEDRDPYIYLSRITGDEVKRILYAMFGKEKVDLAVGETLYYMPDMIIIDEVYEINIRNDLVYASDIISTNNFVMYFNFAAIALLIILVGGRTAVEAASIVVKDYRPFFAMIIARGHDPKKLNRSVSLLVIVLAGVSGVVGGLAAWYLLVGLAGLPTTIGLGSFIVLGLLGSLLVGLYVGFRTMKVIREIRAIEAVRPVESIVESHRRVDKKVGAALGLGLVSLAIGLLGGPARIFEQIEAGGVVAAVLVFLLIIGYMYAPLMPATLSYYTSYLLEGVDRLYSAASRVAARLAGSLREIALASSRRLRNRISSNVTTMALAFGVALGASLAYSSIRSFTSDMLRAATSQSLGTFELGLVAALDVSTVMYRVLAVFALAVALIATLASTTSTFRLIEGEVVVLRARGASRRDAASFIYGMMAPVMLYTLLIALVTAAVLYVSAIALTLIIGLEEILDYGVDYGKFLVPPDPMFYLVLGLTVLILAASPFIVSLGVLRRGEIARLLRERRMG